LILSFHGIPLRYATEGDPYPEQCRTTAKLIAQAHQNWTVEDWKNIALSDESRFLV